MLYSILTVILAIYVCATPYFYVKAVKFGVKLATKPQETAEEPIFSVPDKQETVEISEEMRKQAILERNIEAYDGTSFGQEEII